MKGSSRQVLLNRYDNFFGKGTSSKLLRFQNELKNNLFIRVNLSRSSVGEIEVFLKKNRVKFSKTFLPNCFKIGRSFFNLSSSVEALSGKIYIQDLASQVPINLVDFGRLKCLGRKVFILDMAASPGSKTTQLADLLNFYNIDYEIVALEPEVMRLQRLINNIQKQGFENIKVINCRGESFKAEKMFDLIVLDAPCSGNLIDDRRWLDKRDLGGIKNMAALQKKLLARASSLLAKDGSIVYSTCSLEVEEDEENVDFAVKKLGLKVEKVNMDFGFETVSVFKNQDSIRLMPYKSKTQGFFVCVLRR